MSEVIGWSEEDGCHWPPGFESLRSISVGVSIGQLPHEEEEEEYYDGFGEFTKLFHIPNPKNIYFNGFSCQEDEWEEHTWSPDLLPDGTSSVETLFLDGAEGGWEDFYAWICTASRKLDTVVLRAIDSRRGRMNDLSGLVDRLTEITEWKRLVLYHPAAMQNQLHRQTDIYDSESLKQMTIAAVEGNLRFDDYTMDENIDIQFAFPPNIEAVYIWGESNEPLGQE